MSHKGPTHSHKHDESFRAFCVFFWAILNTPITENQDIPGRDRHLFFKWLNIFDWMNQISHLGSGWLFHPIIFFVTSRFVYFAQRCGQHVVMSQIVSSLWLDETKTHLRNHLHLGDHPLHPQKTIMKPQHEGLLNTLAETDMAPENRPKEIYLPTIDFEGLC